MYKDMDSKFPIKNVFVVKPSFNVWLEGSEFDYLYKSTAIRDVNNLLIEFAARLCYNSLPRFGSAPKFVPNVLEKGHLSVAEHASFYIRKEQRITDSGNFRPWLEYPKMYKVWFRNRFIDMNQNAIFGNARALAETIYNDVNADYNKIIASVLATSLPDLFVRSEDVPLIELKTNEFYVAPANGVTLLAFNVGSMIEDEIKSIRDRYKWARYTFLIEGISRNCSHQIARHRGASISQESQRYVDSGNAEFVYPPDFTLKQIEWLSKNYGYSMAVYDELRKAGANKEDARFCLPSGIKTRMVISFNYRELLHFFNLRCDKHAQWEIRNVALEMLRQAFLITPTKRTTELSEMYERFTNVGTDSN